MSMALVSNHAPRNWSPFSSRSSTHSGSLSLSPSRLNIAILHVEEKSWISIWSLWENLQSHPGDRHLPLPAGQVFPLWQVTIFIIFGRWQCLYFFLAGDNVYIFLAGDNVNHFLTGAKVYPPKFCPLPFLCMYCNLHFLPDTTWSPRRWRRRSLWTSPLPSGLPGGFSSTLASVKMMTMMLMLMLMLMFNLTLTQGKARLGLFLPGCSAWWASITIFCVESDFLVCSVQSEHDQCTSMHPMHFFLHITILSGVGRLCNDHRGLVHGQPGSLPRPW